MHSSSGPPLPPSAKTAGGDMVAIPGGTFIMGIGDGAPYEGPAHEVTVKPFKLLDRHEVTAGQFAKFVAETGHSG